MPNISTFMYCNEAVSDGPRLQLNNPLQVINPIFIPSTFSFAIVFGIMNMDITERGYSLQVVFHGPEVQGKPLIDTGHINLEKNLEPPSPHLPKEMRGMMINLDFRNVVFRVEGIHRTKVYLDNNLLGEFPIYVIGSEKNA